MTGSTLEYRLIPSLQDGKNKTMTLSVEQWDKATKYSRDNGYAPQAISGMARGLVRHFGEALQKAVTRKKVAAEDHDWLGSLLTFLENDGAAGFTLKRGIMAWNSAAQTTTAAKRKAKADVETSEGTDNIQVLGVLARLVAHHGRVDDTTFDQQVKAARSLLRKVAPDLLREEDRLAQAA